MKRLTTLLLSLIIVGCATKEQVDLIVTNANAYTVNDQFESAQAFAIKAGRFVAVGTNDEILKAYESEESVDADGKTIANGVVYTSMFEIVSFCCDRSSGSYVYVRTCTAAMYGCMFTFTNKTSLCVEELVGDLQRTLTC